MRTGADILRGGAVAAVLCGLCSVPRVAAAESDWLPVPQGLEPAPAALDAGAERKADAIARFVQGLLEEESDGPDTSLATYLDALKLDPGHLELALRVSQDYLRRGDTVSALAVLKDAHKARPGDPEPAIALALVYLRHLGKTDLAQRFAQKALAAAPKEIGPHEALWEIAMAGNQPSRAARVLDRAAASGSDDPDFWLALAELRGRTAWQESRPPDEAATEKILAHLDRAVGLAGDDPGVLVRAGDLMALARNTARAVEAYEKAYALRSSLPDLRHKLAACYIELNRIPEATGMLEEIVKLDPLNIAAYDHLSQLHLRAGDLRKAAGHARKALILDPLSIQRHELVVDMLFKLGDFTAAADTIAEARRNFPGVPKLAVIQAVALANAGRNEEAVRIFEEAAVEAADVQPEILDGEFYFHYGAAAEQAGRREKAEQMFRRSIKLDPPNAARAYNYLGYMWVDRNENLDEAEQFIRRALELDPTNGAYIDSLGWLYYRRGKFEDALATLLRAAEHLPEPDAVVLDHIGDAFEKLGRTAEAVLYWNKALALDPENAAIAAKADALTDQVVRQPSAAP
jgi:tetratricopeptide (TPR) repeat protein